LVAALGLVANATEAYWVSLAVVVALQVAFIAAVLALMCLGTPEHTRSVNGQGSSGQTDAVAVVTTFLSVPIRGTGGCPSPSAATRQAPFSRAPWRTRRHGAPQHDQVVTIFDGGPSLWVHRHDDRPNRVSQLHPFPLPTHDRRAGLLPRVIESAEPPVGSVLKGAATEWAETTASSALVGSSQTEAHSDYRAVSHL
jgi:hypothetical protein